MSPAPTTNEDAITEACRAIKRVMLTPAAMQQLIATLSSNYRECLQERGYDPEDSDALGSLIDAYGQLDGLPEGNKWEHAA